METKFVKPFSSPQMVIRRRTLEKLGVYDGARVFNNGYYALLKDGVVMLYNYRCQQLFEDWELEDAWVAPNGYRLIKRKGEEMWMLYSSSGNKFYASGEKAAVFNQGCYTLVFLKQKGKAEWLFYDVNKNSILPKEQSVKTEEIEVRYDTTALGADRLMFILTSGGKAILQRINALFMEPVCQIPNVAFYEFLPDGSIVTSVQPMMREEGKDVVKVMPQACASVQLYSPDLKSCCQADGVVMFSSGMFFRCHGIEWFAFAGRYLVARGIYDLRLYAGVKPYNIGVEGGTSGKPVRAYKCTAEKVMLEYADKRYFIFNGTVVIHADLSQDVFLI